MPVAPQEHFEGLHADIKVREGILLVTLSGKLTFDSGLLVLKQMCDTAQENEISKILVNALEMHGKVSTIESYHFGLKMVAQFKQRQMKPWLAFVGKPLSIDGFAVRVAQNRGLGAEVFSTEQDARNWLGKWPS